VSRTVLSIFLCPNRSCMDHDTIANHLAARASYAQDHAGCPCKRSQKTSPRNSKIDRLSGGLTDSPLEEDGFELAVPPRRERLWEATPGKLCRLGPEPVSGSALRAAVSDWQRSDESFRGSGTGGSNPVPSSGESSNHRFLV